MENFSSQYLSAIVIILVSVLPKFGVQVGSDELTSWLQAALTVAGGIIIMIKRFKQGGISVLGVRKY